MRIKNLIILTVILLLIHLIYSYNNFRILSLISYVIRTEGYLIT